MRYFFIIISTVSFFATISAKAHQNDLNTEMLLPITPALSPDGSTLVFSWKNDLWSKSTNPKDSTPARRLTFHPARETDPIFSPDGSTIYFNSNRNGHIQIWSMNAEGGGVSKQVTIHSATNHLEDVTADGTHIIYQSVREAPGYSPQRLFIQDIAGTQPEKMLLNASAKSADLSPDGKKLLITREGVAPYRKGYCGTQASQIWLYDMDTGSFTQPVREPHGVLSPLWAKDGKSFYYVSGKGGNFNLWKHDLTTSENKQLTRYTEDSVMFPKIAENGSKIVFRKLFHYYLYDTESGNIDQLTLHHNVDFAQEAKSDYLIKHCNDADFSPSGLEITFTADGQLFAMDTILREPKLLSETDSYKSNAAFGDKGTAIYYIHDDGINTSINKLTKKQPSEYWWDTMKFIDTMVIHSQETIKSFELSPNKKKIAYHTDSGKLYVYDLKTKTEKLMASSWSPPSFDWSPDSKWLAYSLMDNNFNSDIYMTPLDGSEKPTNITKHPDNEFAPTFSPDGKKLAFVGKRRGANYDIYYVDLSPVGKKQSSREKKIQRAQNAMKRDPIYRSASSKLKRFLKGINPAQTPPKKAATANKPTSASKTPPKKLAVKTPAKKIEKPKKPKKYDLVDIQKRIVRLQLKGGSPGAIFWKNDSKSILFKSKATGSATYAIDIRSKNTSKFINTTGRPIRYDKNGTLYWISNGFPSVLKGKRSMEYRFSVQTNYDLKAYIKHIYRLIWRTMRDSFYDAEMNGKNWSAIREKYERAATHAESSEEFERVIMLLLGELNASHCGYRSSSDNAWQPNKAWNESMRHLGISYKAKPSGWHVTKVLPKSPASHINSLLTVGDIITEIDGKPVSDATIQHTVLWGQMETPFQLKVTNLEGLERKVSLSPISLSAARTLNTEAMIDNNKKTVEALSNGKLGYLHISRMMWDEFEKFEQHLYENGAGKDGIIIDIRDNRGGFTTDHLLTALTQPRHAFTIPRHGASGYPQDRFVYATWNRPLVVICNQNSFSNAEIFTHAIRSLNRGKIVGVATAGGVISAGSKNILNNGTLRIPFRGWFNINTGQDMELSGAKPHFTIWTAPGELSASIDKQLDKAVTVLMDEVKQDKAKRQTVKPVYRNRK